MESKIYFRENWLIFWDFRVAEKFFMDFRSKTKYFQGPEDFFQRFGEINAFLREQGGTDPLGAS